MEAPGDNVVTPDATSWNMHVTSLSDEQSNDPWIIWIGKDLKKVPNSGDGLYTAILTENMHKFWNKHSDPQRCPLKHAMKYNALEQGQDGGDPR